jgi:DNA-binding LacI/PurR family transcriptional regulator
MAMSAYRSAELLVQSGCTAIVVSNNVMTLDVLGYLSEHRLRVNEDIRVIGYSEDENNLFLEKQIDHISQPVGEMSCIASSRLLELIKEPRTKKKDLVLYGSLIDAVSDC